MNHVCPLLQTAASCRNKSVCSRAGSVLPVPGQHSAGSERLPDSHPLRPGPSERSSCCWDVPCSGGTEEVAEMLVLDGDRTRAAQAGCPLQCASLTSRQREAFPQQGERALRRAFCLVQLMCRARSCFLQCPRHGPRRRAGAGAGWLFPPACQRSGWWECARRARGCASAWSAEPHSCARDDYAHARWP